MFRLYFFFQFLKNLIFYFFSEYKRYAQLLLIVFLKRPKSIVEIGVYKGKRSKELIEVAKIFNNKINYYGFDLFDLFNRKIDLKEFSKKPDSENDIKYKLSKLANVMLFKGFTHNTLSTFNKKIDLIFIDGGHSVKTIANDWHYVKKMMHKDTYVLFDDYYSNNKKIIRKFGCNNIISELPDIYQSNVLPIKDKIKRLNNTKVQIVLVKKV
jgi:hypothetical protein